MRWSPLAATALLAGLLLAGCSTPPARHAGTTTTAAGPTLILYEVRCRLQDLDQRPLAGTCGYDFPDYTSTATTDANGTAMLRIAKGLRGTVTGSAPGHADSSVGLVVDGPKSIRFTLGDPETTDAPAASGSATVEPGPTAPGSLTSTTTASGNSTTPVVGPPRAWGDPVTVVPGGGGAEPQLAIAGDGTVYYSPLSSLYRSTDAGLSFQNISPHAAPVQEASDTAVQVAPDGSVWWTDDWPYAGSTQGCTSVDRGATWTCDIAAVPGVTDRMWIAGLSAKEGYLMTNLGTEWHAFFHTTDGSSSYVPTATTTSSTVRNGNMVYDAVHHKVWEIEFSGSTMRLIRIDGASALVSYQDTDVPATYGLPWLAVYNGTLWTTGEKDGKVYAAYSMDEGATWTQTQVSSAPAWASFSYIAAGAGGRVAVVYLGSDKGGAINPNGGTWSLYVAETADAFDASPTWVESQVVPEVHKGNLCIGLNCEQTGGDSKARMEGDLIGIALDAQGNAHVAYVQDNGDQQPAMYLRQHLL